MKRFYSLAAIAALVCCTPLAHADDAPATSNQQAKQTEASGNAPANNIAARQAGVPAEAAVQSLRSALSDVQRMKASPRSAIRAGDPHVMPEQVQGVRATARGAAAEATRSIGEGATLQQGRTAPADARAPGASKASRATRRSAESGSQSGASSVNPRVKPQ